MQNRENNSFYSELGSESLLVTKIWDFNRTILNKWADVDLLIGINETRTNKKMKKGLKNIANNLREIADKLDKAAEEKKYVELVITSKEAKKKGENLAYIADKEKLKKIYDLLGM